MRIERLILSALFLPVIALSGCGGGGGGGGDTVAPTFFAGMASKGPISGATVKVFAIRSGKLDSSAPAGQGQTDNSGNFSINAGSFQGPAVVEVTSGSFTDEVTGESVSLNAPLHAIISNAQPGSTVVAVTPLTELAFRKAKGSLALTTEAIIGANANVAGAFGLSDIISTMPIAGGTSDGQKNYAAACASFSQLANDVKSDGQSLADAMTQIITQMGNEEEQGGSLSADTIKKFNTAVATFNVSPVNQTGGTAPSLSPPVSFATTGGLPAAPIGGLLSLSAAGAPSVIAGIDVRVNLPAGVIVAADPLTGETAPGVVTMSGEAAVGDAVPAANKVAVAKYTPASIGSPAQLHIVMANAVGFVPGEFVTIQFDLATGTSFPTASAFSVASFFAKGLDGSGLAGITAAPASVQGI
jgi:hypothetical protein